MRLFIGMRSKWLEISWFSHPFKYFSFSFSRAGISKSTCYHCVSAFFSPEFSFFYWLISQLFIRPSFVPFCFSTNCKTNTAYIVHKIIHKTKLCWCKWMNTDNGWDFVCLYPLKISLWWLLYFLLPLLLLQFFLSLSLFTLPPLTLCLDPD